MSFGVVVARVCPIHLGHEVIIWDMISQCAVDHSLLVIGSVNHEPSMRHFFSYLERKNFVKKLFPDLKVVGLPDFKSDDEWFEALQDILNLAGFIPSETRYFGGCEEDIQFFMDRNLPVRIINRFDGSSPKVSATEARDALVHNRSLDNILNPLIANDVKELFDEKWEKFKRI